MQISPKQAVQLVQQIVNAALLNRHDSDLAQEALRVLAELAKGGGEPPATASPPQS